ncbi:hypothetical protein [Oculatella sp. LEGE 06141]|nr:hypothetical protein [Oculatella sp. LEGE 06141]
MAQTKWVNPQQSCTVLPGGVAAVHGSDRLTAANALCSPRY